LFVEKGFSATSLRSIATQADANLAAAHYHFGSKQGLLEALVHRRMTPINQARLAALDKLIAMPEAPGLRQVLQAFFQPLIETSEVENLPALIGRIHSEPPSITKPVLEKQFGEVATRFQEVLADLLPDLPRDQLRWRFHFMVGAMLQTLTMPLPLGETKHVALEAKFEQLIDFAAAGFTAASQTIGDSE
jgi:AcrR family transcriptional regulator